MAARRRLVPIALAVLAACGGEGTAITAHDPTLAPAPTTASSMVAPPPVAAPPPTSSPPLAPATTPAPTPTPTTTIPVPTTADQPTHVLAPGTHHDDELVIHLAFESEIDDLTSLELEAAALAVLNTAGGWNEAGFFFVADPESRLRVVLAEGRKVDELCDPFETFGRVSCQNGPIVALNADRWREAFDEWQGSVEDYRHYLITHEVGHLIGLRHPVGRCPTDTRVSAVMEPQTNNLGRCLGNERPLEWELEWALNRPAVIGPSADWEGPRPQWPTN